MTAEIMLTHNGLPSFPPVEEGITVDFERKGAPGRMAFSIVTQSNVPIDCGDHVLLKVNNKPFFAGYAFTIKYTGSGDKQEIVAYDQLRYLKNKHTYVYSDKRADQLTRMIASDFLLETGFIENTGFTIPSRIEDNQTLFDIIYNALDQTLLNTGQLYVLYDDVGRLSLRNVQNMQVNFLIDDGNAEDFIYERSIDRATYNRIRVVVEDGDAGNRKVYQAEDSSNIARWGVLQLTEKADTAVTAQSKAMQMLNYYNRETRTLSLQNVLGDTRVRAGCSAPVSLDLSDITLQQYLVAEKVRHVFRENEHFMELEMRGGIITG